MEFDWFEKIKNYHELYGYNKSLWGKDNTKHETASVCESWDLMRDPKLSIKCAILRNEGITNCPVPQISTNTWILSPYQQSKAGISKKIQLMYVST